MAESDPKMRRFGWTIVWCLRLAFVECFQNDEQQLRFPAAINPPLFYVQKEANGSLTYRGSSIHLANYLATALNMTYKIVPVNGTLLAQRGFTQLLIDMLLNDEINIISLPLTPSLARRSYMDFSYPLSMDPYKIMYPWPQEVGRLLVTLRPYQTTVWILFAVSFIATSLLLGFVSWFWSLRQGSEVQAEQQFGRNLMYVIAIALGQGDFLPYQNHSARIAATGWCLMVVVLVNSYSSILTSLLALPVYEKPINSFEDLAERTDVQLMLPSDSVLLQSFQEAQSGPYKIIGDSFRKNPGSVYKTIDEGLRKLFSGKYGYTSTGFYIEYLIAGDYKLKKKCQLTLSKSLAFSTPFTYGLPKNGPHNQIINFQFMRMWEYGFIKRWMDMDRGPYEQCVVKSQSPRNSALKLKDLYGAFIVLLLGFGLCIVAFAVEVTGSYIFKRNWYDNNSNSRPRQ